MDAKFERDRTLRDLSRAAAALLESLHSCSSQQRPSIIQALDEIEAACDCLKAERPLGTQTPQELCLIAITLVAHADRQSPAVPHALLATAAKHLKAAQRRGPKNVSRAQRSARREANR